jgi:L-ascorbate metabolism protein UlaG (beta-lactamase superfamily)
MSLPLSDHCNGKTFFNPGPWKQHGLRDILKWKLTSRAARWPRWVELPAFPTPPTRRDDQIALTWIGHSTFLLQTRHGNFLTDPVFSDRVSPVTWAGPRRVHAPGIAFEKLPRIDGILLSHDHYDHCDLPTLRRLAASHPARVIAPLGHRSLLESAGLRQVEELDWWQSHLWAPDLEITLTPTRHWSRRKIGGTNGRLWGGFYLRCAGAPRVYFVGDSGYEHGLFAEVRRRCGAPNLALIPIGAYEPRWFMQGAHMNPAEAVQVHRTLEADLSLAMHWGTWQLTDEAREAPVQALREALVAERVPPSAFRVLSPGESVVV